MSYTSRKRPNEYASKSSHSYIINDSEVVKFLEQCELPKEHYEIELKQGETLFDLQDIKNPIKHIIAIDGGYTEAIVKKKFQASKIAFFQFGALLFDLIHLDKLSQQPFIFPEDMSRFKDLDRIKLVLPIRHISYRQESSLTISVRKVVFDFFTKTTYIDTLKWLIFEEYHEKKEAYILASCPNKECQAKSIKLSEINQIEKYVYECENCKQAIYLTDVFRLHEAIDDELGAGGILGYITTLIEQIILVHHIKYILKKQPSFLNEILFIKDGPLAFFGQTANMHKPMRNLTNFLLENHNLYLAGLEKSGAFVDHADEITNYANGKSKLQPGQILLLDNKYIYTYIIPGKSDTQQPYACTSYYSGKLIFKARNGSVYVVTIPVRDENVILHPKHIDFKNLDVILLNLEKLKCDMYDNSLVPIALVNHLVSLANHPSSILLEKFAKAEVSR